MNNRTKKFLHLIIVECKISRQKLMELWDETPNIDVKCKYNLFVKETFTILKENDPSLNRREIMLQLRNQWKNLSEEDKLKYVVIEEKKPKRPSAYHLYFKEQYPLIKKINPQFNLASISKEISMKWKSLSQDEKDVYVQKISEDEKYKKIKETHSNLTQTIQVTAPKDDVVEDEFSLKYFLGNHSLSEGQLKMVKSKDRYLTTKEKEEIENICLVLKDKSVESLRKMYENNYNVPVPNYWNVDTILENVYIMERRDKLIRNFETLLSKLKLKLTKSEEDEIHQKVQEWRDMESLGDYYTSIFDDDMIVRNKSEMILRLKDKMVNDFLKKKFCDTVSIHGF